MQFQEISRDIMNGRLPGLPWIWISTKNGVDMDMDMDGIFYLHGKPAIHRVSFVDGCYFCSGFSNGFAVSHLNVNNFMNLGPI